MTAAIHVRDLHFSYPDGTRALNGVTVDIRSGESVALFGPNGSGKTTFVLHLNGLLRGSGEVRIGGQRVEKKNLRAVRQRVGLVFQDADDQLFMPTVAEDVMFGPLNHGLSPEQARQAAGAALDLVGLTGVGNRAPYQLSAGEKRRAALAGVLAVAPDILVLDEPTSSLDPPGRAALIALLERLPQTRLIVTHDLDLARQLCSRALFFEKGRIAADGPVDRVIEQMSWDKSGAFPRARRHAPADIRA